MYLTAGEMTVWRWGGAFRRNRRGPLAIPGLEMLAIQVAAQHRWALCAHDGQ